jgi:hypothetical protein
MKSLYCMNSRDQAIRQAFLLAGTPATSPGFSPTRGSRCEAQGVPHPDTCRMVHAIAGKFRARAEFEPVKSPARAAKTEPEADTTEDAA